MNNQDGDDQDVPRVPTLEGNKLTCSTGVVLKIKTPPPVLAGEALMRAEKEKPKPPMVFNKDKERDEENPNDPDYKTNLNLWIATSGIRTLRTLLPMSTEFVSKPDDIVGFMGDPDYDDLMEAMALDPGKGRFTRYVEWILKVALGEEDLRMLTEEIMRRVGVREEDVRAAQNLFPGIEKRIADRDVPGERSDRSGDQVSTTDA